MDVLVMTSPMGLRYQARCVIIFSAALNPDISRVRVIVDPITCFLLKSIRDPTFFKNTVGNNRHINSSLVLKQV